VASYGWSSMIEFLKILITILACLVTVVAVIYGVRSPWYRLPVGQRLFADRVVMAGILWFQVLGMMGVIVPLGVWVGFIILFIIIEIWNFILILRAQAQARKVKP
jgi:hypothetical protein